MVEHVVVKHPFLDRSEIVRELVRPEMDGRLYKKSDSGIIRTWKPRHFTLYFGFLVYMQNTILIKGANTATIDCLNPWRCRRD